MKKRVGLVGVALVAALFVIAGIAAAISGAKQPAVIAKVAPTVVTGKLTPMGTAQALPTQEPDSAADQTVYPTELPTYAPLPTTAPPPLTAIPARVLFSQSGTGTWTSNTFAAPANWWLGYRFDCSGTSDGSASNFIVLVTGPNHQPSLSGIDELKVRGNGVTAIHDAQGPGTYIEVLSTCAWSVRVSG